MNKTAVQLTEPYDLDTHPSKWIWARKENGIPEEPGVYMISIIYGKSRARKIMYVGQSSNLKQRITSHPNERILKAFGFETKIHFIVIKQRPLHQFNLAELFKVEKHLILLLDPPMNIDKNYVSFSIEKMIIDELNQVVWPEGQEGIKAYMKDGNLVMDEVIMHNGKLTLI